MQSSQTTARQTRPVNIPEFSPDAKPRPRSPASWPRQQTHLVVVVLAKVHPNEFLDPAAGDRSGNIDVALGINSGRVPEREMTRIVSGARKYPAHAERPKHHRSRLVDQPGIVIAEIDIDNDVLARRALGCEVVHIRPEIDVAGTGRERGQNGRGIFWCGALERIVA